TSGGRKRSTRSAVQLTRSPASRQRSTTAAPGRSRTAPSMSPMLLTCWMPWRPTSSSSRLRRSCLTGRTFPRSAGSASAFTPAIALDRLDHDGCRLVAHGGLHGGEVAVGDEADAGQQGEEARVVLLLPGGSEGREGAPVEGARGGEDLEAPAALLRAPAPRELHRRLVRLGAAVREEDALGERVPAEERAQLAGGERVVDVGG